MNFSLGRFFTGSYRIRVIFIHETCVALASGNFACKLFRCSHFTLFFLFIFLLQVTYVHEHVIIAPIVVTYLLP